jgi:hypothetical protein
MARNNGDRLGARTPQAPSPMAAAPQSNPMLAFATPTTFVDLPSKGAHYPEGHPLHGRDQIEIKFMTAKEEDILTSQALLKKGIAIDRMLQSIILDQSVRVEDLLVGDKNALLIAARISGYGNMYEVKVTCPSCGTATDHSFDLEKIEALDISEIDESQVVMTERGTFVATTPILGAKVEMRLLTGADEQYLTQLALNKKKKNLPASPLVDQMRRFIVSINDSNDMNLRESFFNSVPARDTKYLRKIYRSVTPNLDMRQDFTCPNCAAQSEMAVPLTVKFFWSE